MIRLLLAFALFLSAIASGAPRPRISEDRELTDLDLAGWDCVNRLEGSAKTPDGVERNTVKNRSAVDLSSLRVEAMDTPAFLKKFAQFDGQTKGTRRTQLNAPQKQQLDALEKQVVSLTGYLVLAYAGPPETTNCASTDFHDWHLEVFEKPLDHPPEIGDPTPIICEITPRTQRAIFRDTIRLQALAGFLRAPDLTYEPTGHKAQRIRLTGFLTWDDDHDGAADVGATIQSIGANKYHNPWRATAWEIHPVMKIEALEAAAPGLEAQPSPAQPTPVPSATAIPIAASPAEQFVTLTQPVKIKIPYGETTLPRGMKLSVVSRDAQTVTVRYLTGTQVIPVGSTTSR